MDNQIAYAVLLLAATFYVLNIVYRHLSSPLRSVRGPFLARFTDGWYFWRLWLGHFEKDNQRLHSIYGPIVRYGPNRYSFQHPEATRIIYGHKPTFSKSSWYSAFGQPNEWTIFSDQDITRHAQNRKQYTNVYSLSSLVSYEPYVEDCVSVFRQRLVELAHTGLPVNMGFWMQCYAFDVIGMITYSKRLGFLDQGQDVGNVISMLDKFLEYAVLAGLTPSLHPAMFRFRNWLAGSKGAGRSYVINFTKQCMMEYQSKARADLSGIDDEDSIAKLDFLSKFYSTHTKDPNTFTTYHIVAGCSHNMVAGSDTTAVSLSSCLYYLLKYPQTFTKLRAEIDQIRSEGRMTEMVSFKETQKMPYLQAVIKEALRMHPATGLPLERVVPKGGATIAGRQFPEGTIVGVNSWVEHRNRQIWGDDADEFKPERWLIQDTERLLFLDRHWMPFGLGSRVCLGRHISFLEMAKLLPSLVGGFDFELCGPLALLKSQWTTTDYWFVKPRDLMVRMRVREVN